jgi:hypothetical protein
MVHDLHVTGAEVDGERTVFTNDELERHLKAGYARKRL